MSAVQLKVVAPLESEPVSQSAEAHKHVRALLHETLAALDALTLRDYPTADAALRRAMMTADDCRKAICELQTPPAQDPKTQVDQALQDWRAW